ncbi:MAG TPA: hypothetical protein DCE78_05875 [Bacteroidetes bacterium]|nr:hypothetical protein [Bacteroidota bacterium]
MSLPQDHLLDRLKKLPSEIRLLIEKRIELYVIEFGEKFSNGFSKAIASILSFVVFGLAIIFALFAAAFFIGDMLDSYAIGFSVVAAFLLVVGLVVYLLSPELIEVKVRESIASVFLDNDNPNSETTKFLNAAQINSTDTPKNSVSNGQNQTSGSKNEVFDNELTEWESESSAHTIKNTNIN